MNATIAVLPGDGIGPEVTREAVRVLQAVAQQFGHTFTLKEGHVGGEAIDRWGTPLPEDTLGLALQADAVLFGAVGGPKWSDPRAKVRPEQGILGLRKHLELFANIRPVRVFPDLVEASTLRPEVIQGVDLVVVREATGGLYFGAREEGTERAYDTLIYTRPEVERVVRLAGELARKRRGYLVSVDKANVLASSRLWRHVAGEVVREEFPDVRFEHILVDAMAMHLIRRPGDFDVIVTGNMFGDILTDEASMLAGSLGMLPSATLGASQNRFGLPRGLYEPIHGSAPDIAGQGKANPLASILSAALLLRYSLGLEEEAAAVEQAVEQALHRGYRTADIAQVGQGTQTLSTEEMGRAVVEHLGSSTGKTR
ncbi:MAG: 3-isopropylmalate dehydrogenase [Chloroflexi bacterium]|nr:3-isopropylmalate dehydrogenase [Chloroflexota bacterium]